MTWGTPVRLRGGHLTHYAGSERDGVRWLAHGSYAWTDTIRDAGYGARECSRCVRSLPALEKLAARMAEAEPELRAWRESLG